MLTTKELPQPQGNTFTGHLADFKKDNKHQILEEWANKHNDLYRIRLVTKNIIVSAKPTINDFILKNRPQKFRRFTKIGEVMNEMNITGVFTAEGEQWKQHRKLAVEALNHKNTKSYFPIIKATTKRLINHINKKQNTSLDIQTVIMKYTIDITTQIAFGYDGNTLENPNDPLQKHLEKVFPTINARIAAPLPIWKIVKTSKVKEFDHSLEYIKTIIHKYIDEAKGTITSKPKNFLEALLLENQKENLTDEEIFGNVFTMLLAGEDTTSNSISWAIYFLAINPKVVELARKEINQVCPGGVVQSVEQLDHLSFIEGIALETLRLKPVSPTLIMEALENTQVADLQINEGDIILLQNKVAQTKEEYFSNAKEFKPQRWLKESKCPAHSPQQIRVFGGGPRFCPGKALAIDEIKTSLVSFISNFEVELAVPEEQVTEKAAFAMQPQNLKVKIKKI